MIVSNLASYLVFFFIANIAKQNNLHTTILCLLCTTFYTICMQGEFNIWFSPKQCHLPPPPKNSSFNCTVCWPVEGTIEEKMESLKETMIDLWTKSCSNVQDSVVSLTFYQGESCSFISDSLYIVMKLINCRSHDIYLVDGKIIVEMTSSLYHINREHNNASAALKVLNTFGNCQRPVFSLGVSHKHKITSLWKFGLNWSSKLRENDERKNTLVGQICLLSYRNKRLLARSLLLF